MPAVTRRPRLPPLRLAACALSGLIMLSTPGLSQQLGAPAGAALDYRDPSSAPPSWIQFAKLVKYRFESWMTADEAVARRDAAFSRQHLPELCFGLAPEREGAGNAGCLAHPQPRV
jgi:hypothetical protein